MDNENKSAPHFGYELLRDYVLPSVLGKHEGDILYWAGKELARQFPLNQIEEVIHFFQKANWGILSERKSSKKEAYYVLDCLDNLKGRKHDFQLEAGFIAEQFQKMTGYLTECYAKIDTRKNIVIFHIAWDRKDSGH